MKVNDFKGVLQSKPLIKLIMVSIGIVLPILTLAFVGFSSGTHVATVSMVPGNSRPGENTGYTLTVTNESGDNIDNVTLEIPLDGGGHARYRVATPVPSPENWKSEVSENDGFGYARKIRWRTDNAWAQITAGASKSFTFTATTPLYDATYNWTCRTRDIVGYTDNDSITTRVDNTPPSTPILLWPDNGENINDNTPILDWNPVTDLSMPVTYDLLMDNDADFLSPEINISVTRNQVWWNENWLKRRPITISGSHPENYQLRIVIPYDSDMRLDYGDLRFTENGNGPELNYWVENYTADNAIVWIRRLENADNTIYVYYQNPSATTSEEGRDVFIVFDDFNGGPEQWTEVDPNNHITIDRITNHRLDFMDLARTESAYVYLNTTVSENVILESTYLTSNSTNNGVSDICGISDVIGSSNAWTNMVDAEIWNSYCQISSRVGGTYYESSSLNFAKNVPYWVRLTKTRNPDNLLLQVYTDATFTNLYGTSRMTNVPSASLSYVYALSSRNTGTVNYLITGWVDNIRVRKYASPEPTTSVGDEEKLQSITDANYQIAIELPDGICYWKIRAVDNAGNIGLWSPTEHFRVDVTPPPSPMLVWPTDGASINGNSPRLNWNPVTDSSMPVTYDLVYGWNENWFKHRPITIFGSHPENYQIKIVVPYDNDMHSDYGDLRFLENEASGELNYWIENYTVDNATVWVRRLENSDNTIYVYYGNPSATTTESGESTFEFFDDFSGNSLDTSKWTGDTSYASVSSSVLTYDVNVSSWHRISSIRTFGKPTILETRAKMYSHYQQFGFMISTDQYISFDIEASGKTVLCQSGGGHYTRNSSDYSSGIFSRYRLVWKTSNSSFYEDGYEITGSPITTNVPSLDLSAGIEMYHQQIDVDWIFVRKYCATEPTASVGAEEGLQTGITDDNYQIATELAEGVYSWKVRAVDNAGNLGSWSPLQSFREDVTPPGTTTLLSPNDTMKICDNTPTFRWIVVTDVSLPVTYELQADNDNNFLSPEVNITGLEDNTYTQPAELANGRYSWHVCARDNASNAGPWSQTWSLLINSTPHDATVTINPFNSKPGISIDYVLTVTDNATGDNIDTVTLEIPLDENGNALYRVATLILTPPGWISEIPTIDYFGYATTIRWWTDNSWAQIAAGASKDFNFTAITPLYYGFYNWVCLTRDIIGYTDNDNFTTRVRPFHDPILIAGNENFIPANGVTSGSGTENDPHIIENWDISAENANGIEITNTTAYFVIRNCHIHDGMHDYNGILFENVANGEIENNIAGNNYSGIYLQYSHNNLIENNIVENNWYPSEQPHTYEGIGILLYTSNNNLILNNIVKNNVDGIRPFYETNNNIILNNTMENNFYGISPGYYSDNNLIYHNNLLNNTNQAYDDGSNHWDNGYPSGGNYWSNYAGADNYHGQNQNIAGGEGIGDTPYSISGGSNQDRYPLMDPWPSIIENYFDIHLLAGWDLVGFVTEDTPNNVFSGLAYYTDYYIYTYAAPGGPYNIQDPDTACKDNTGYWIWINQNKTVGTSGTRPVSENIHLVPGWNLVSFPVVNENTTPNNIFAPLNYFENYIIYYWNAPGGPYGLQDSDTPLKDNTGYWVWIDQDMTVTVP